MLLLADLQVFDLDSVQTLYPASPKVRSWLMTPSTKVIYIFSKILVFGQPFQPCPPPPPPSPLSLSLSVFLFLWLWLPLPQCLQSSQNGFTVLFWGFFVAGWLVISFVSRYFQLCVSVCYLKQCVLIRWGSLEFHFCLKLYEIVCSVQAQVCCRKKKALYRIATKV